MFTFGFSYVGLIYLLMFLIPSFIWLKNRPEGYTSEGESKVLRVLEKIGGVLCGCFALIFSDFNIHCTEWIAWLILSFLSMFLYEIYWIRYFKSEKQMKDFYKPMFGVKVPGASLPVTAFFLLGIYGTNIFMIVASVILGIGHIGIHKRHYRDLAPAKPKLAVRILKFIVTAVFGLVFLLLSFFIGARNFNYMIHYRLIAKGVDEGIFVELGGQEQYLLIRGADKSNPVIVFLHGGPSSPESYENYCWVDDVVDEYTVIDWDQRGCGRTYEHNKDIDPENETASYEQALLDLDDLVDYACKRFGKDEVILVGHSYGTVLGASYIERHPEKVSQYVSIAQVVSMDISNRVMVEEALKSVKDSGDDASALDEKYTEYLENPGVSTTMELRKTATPLLPKEKPEKSTWIALTSPYMGMGDFKWFLLQLGSLEDYLALNQKLYDSLLDFNLYDVAMPADVPVHFISGTRDYVCPVVTIEEYMKKSGIHASLHTLEDCGHNVQYTEPHEVSRIILEVLSGE